MSATGLSSLSLFPARKEQILEGRRRWHKQWSAHLTMEEHLNRRARLDNLEHSRDGKLSTWILAPRDDSQTLNFKCCCEIYRRKAILKRPDSDSTEEVFGYGITAVYTPPEYRGKGYALHMMRLIHWVLVPQEFLPPFPVNWGEPPSTVPGFNNAQFSVLYSHIGPNFYVSAGPSEESNGWVVCDPYSTIWDLTNGFSKSIAEPGCVVSYQWLDQDACEKAILADADVMRVSLGSPAGMETETKQTVFAFLPTGGVALSHLRRTPCFDAGQPYPIPTEWGVKLQTRSASGVDSCDLIFATWEPEFHSSPTTLNITRLRATKESFPQLLQLIFAAARKIGMERVKVWNLPKEYEVTAHAFGGITEEREDSLSCFKWYGPEPNEQLHWAYNEKFCWC